MSCTVNPPKPVCGESLVQTLSLFLSQERLQHSLRTAQTAVFLARKFSAPVEKAWHAALLHDCARELREKDLRSLVGMDTPEPDDKAWQEFPILLHGFAGAVMAKKLFHQEDEEILEAIRNHVTGTPGMGLLSQIVFLADFLEPGRTWLPAERREELLALSLIGMLKAVLESTFDYLQKEGKRIAKSSLLLYDEVVCGMQL